MEEGVTGEMSRDAAAAGRGKQAGRQAVWQAVWQARRELDLSLDLEDWATSLECQHHITTARQRVAMYKRAVTCKEITD